MLKLLLCLFCALTLGGVLLELRQQRLEISYQANKLHNQIESRQAALWNQQYQISLATAPNTLKQTLGDKAASVVIAPEADEDPAPADAQDRASAE
jgi:hypothetical protein